MGYYDTKQKIVNSLLGRPDGTQIQPNNHQDFALSLLEYIRSVELISGSTLIGIADVTTVPVQSDNANECYVSACPVGAVLTYENFHGQDGNPITYSADQNSGALLLLLWNKQYWELVDFPTTIQVTAEIINYASSIRKTYVSKEAMEADTNPFGDDGKAIVPGQLVTVVNSTDTTYNGIYARTQNGTWKFQSGFNWSLVQNIGDDANTAMSQKAVTDELNLIHAKIETLKNSGYVFAGIATPTTNPGTPDGPVFYLASEGGTYTNFSAIELQDGLSVLMWNGSWNSQQIFSIDNEPTAGSEKLVKSGGVQQELALGAVYDVSAKNPTAGPNNDGKWESLSALLSDANLNTLVPTAVRKGGMSIKFIQSSDNKYVQARLMANSFTTDVTQWQGVVEEIETKSNNLITSGGVAKNLDIVEFEDEEAVLSFEDLYHRVVEYINKYGEHVFLNKCLMSSLSVDGKDVDMAAISAIELQESEEWGLVLLDKSNRIIKGVLKTGETIDFNIHAEEKQRYITTWGDSLTAQGGWNDYISLMSDLPLHNCGVGGEDVPTICSRQGADSFIINNITIPANGGTVKIADWNNKLQTQLGKLTTPLLQGGGDSFNPVYVNGKAMTLAYTGDFYQSIEGDWVLSNNTNEGAIVIDRPTSIITTQDKEFNAPYLMVIFIGTNGGYSSISELIDYHKYMINHAKATHYLVLGFSFGTAASQADYEAEMKKEFGRDFVSLREYLSTPIYKDGNIISCYGMEDQNVAVDPTYTYDGKTTIEEIELGMVPHQILQDAVHFTSGTQRVIGEMLYKKCIELNIF